MQPAEKKQWIVLLKELRGTVEELLLSGMTSASKSTIERIDVTFKEAARMRLLRLGSTLRIANEEISRFTKGSTQFSPRRLAFFLSRTWLLARAMGDALERNDDVALHRLLATPASQATAKLKVVTLGIAKKVIPGTVATFDFRLRVIEDAPAGEGSDRKSQPIKAGTPLVWSCVFPMKSGQDLPAEAYLHLPQKQKFKPACLLEKNVINITNAAISPQPASTARLILTDSSELKPAGPFEGWHSFWSWNIASCAARLRDHKPTPLDLEIELQEEVFLNTWSPGELQSTEETYDELPLGAEGLALAARIDRGLSGIPLASRIKTLIKQKKSRPPLYGIAHYESCKIIFQPLTILTKDGPDYLTVSRDKISQAELVKAMKFT